MERLQKILAQCGVASRRASEKLILEGRVTVNGVTVRELGTKASLKDDIRVNGRPIEKEEHVYYVLNKPQGYISTVNDPKGRRTILDLISDEDRQKRIYPIGRLDADTAGVLLLTNDGDFANHLMKPNFEVEKEYLARLDGIISNSQLTAISKGVILDGGYKTSPCQVSLESIDKEHSSSLVRIVIHEGKYHQVKRMFEAVDLSVKKLTRIRYGMITLADLPKGSYRPLKIQEIKKLKEL